MLKHFSFQIVLLVTMLVCQQAFAQEIVNDSLVIKDSGATIINNTGRVIEKPRLGQTEVAPVAFHPIPKKAAFYSAIVPGAGQFYNQQYWKMPIIYVGMAACGYFIIDNTKNYRRFRTAYINRSNPLAEQTELRRTTSDLATLRDFYKKNLDLTVLLTVVGYTLQSLDALAFAHLNNFDVSKNISLQVSPVILNNGLGMGLALKF